MYTATRTLYHFVKLDAATFYSRTIPPIYQNRDHMKVALTHSIAPERISNQPHAITLWLAQLHSIWFTLYAALSAFLLYTSIYAFRKTFAVATFQNLFFLGIDFKVWLVLSQVFGYALSKFIGIRMIAELKSGSRATGILMMAAIAWLAWLLFAVIPAPFNIICLFLNGLVLGLVWGMVFQYLEGRKMTEVLGATLSISFIFSSGLCRTAGAYLLLHWNIAEHWMPFVASTIFFIPLLIFLFLLDKVPQPTSEDEQLRTKRQPMNGVERRKFVITFLPGIILFIMAYTLLTAFRDFRDNFSAEVWRDLGYGNSAGIYTTTEIPVALVVLVIMASLMIIKRNSTALMINHLIIIMGMLLIGISTMLFQLQLISPVIWMTLTGLGLYLGYVPFNCIFFDRMIAAFHYIGTVGFIMYVADAFGYLGSIAVLLFKQFGTKEIGWLEFMINTGYFVSAAGALLICGSMIYFYRKHKHWRKPALL
jgi:MFS family permease